MNWRWLTRLFRRRQDDRELEDELRFHLEREVQLRIQAGESPQEAWYAARHDFGNELQVREITRQVWGWAGLQRFVQDLRYALRLLRLNPVFACTVVLILALGIGANIAVFNLVNGVVLKTLPVREPDELVWFQNPSFSYPIFQQVRARQEIFSGLFAWDIEDLNVDWNGQLQSAQVLLASGEFYSTLGVEAAAGRMFGPDDDIAEGGRQGAVAVISYPCWQRRFGGTPDVVGKTITIERVPLTIIGVTPPGFFGVAVGLAPEITVPLTILPKLQPQDADVLQASTQAWLHLMGRLKPGVSRQQANAALQVFWPQALDATLNAGMPPDRRLRYLSRETELMAGATGFSRVRRRFSEPLWLLFALVGLLLLVGCATLANLFLARASARQREIAIRLALGASRGRVVRQLLTEGLVLAGLGGLFGFLASIWGSGILVRFFSTSQNPITLDFGPDWRMVSFTLSTVLITAALFALVPAWLATGVDPGPALKDTSHSLSGGWRRRWLGKSMVVSQVALSILLLSGAALFTRSLAQLLSLDPGFRQENILIVSADALVAGYEGPRLAGFYGRMLELVGGVPGVESASLSLYPPISNEDGSWTQSVAIDGAPPQPEEKTNTYFNAVSPGYFQTLGTPLLAGRDFGVQDNAAATRTVIVNESLGRSFFPNENPIGHHISIGRDASRQNLEIVGVVKDAKYQYLQEPARRIAYLPYLQLSERLAGENLFAEIRSAVPPAALADSVRRRLNEMDGNVPVRFETLSERIRESLVTERVIALISVFLGAIALLLASAGLYGLMAYTVSQRTNEIGIRIALGAPQSSVLWMVLRESLLLTAIGVAAGLAGTLALGRFVATLLHGMKASDPLALAAACLVMVAVTLFAGYLPARRASRLDPVVALRQD